MSGNHSTSKWLSAREIEEHYGIKPSELFDYVKRGLQPYHDVGMPCPPPDVAKRRLSLDRLKTQMAAKRKELSSIEDLLKELNKRDPCIFPRSTRKDPESLIGGKITKLVGEVKETKKRISILEKDSSETSDSWCNYSLPTSTIDANKVLSDLRTRCFRIEELSSFIPFDSFEQRREAEVSPSSPVLAGKIQEKPEEIKDPKEGKGSRRKSTSTSKSLSGLQEIADFLGKSIRTIQHYRGKGMPVRKHDGGGVYAYPEDLNEWRDSHSKKRRPKRQ